MTPVFNGSADLRQAAGQMIEETAKAARRKKEMNDAFLDNLYSDMTSLYHLIQVIQSHRRKGGRSPAGKGIPRESKSLLGGIAGIWILIGLYKLCEGRKKAQKQGKT